MRKNHVLQQNKKTSMKSRGMNSLAQHLRTESQKSDHDYANYAKTDANKTFNM